MFPKIKGLYAFGVSLIVVVALLMGCAGSTQAPQPQVAKSSEASKPSSVAKTEPAPTSKAPLKVGIILSTTGRYAGLGDPQKVGVQLAVDKINKGGGVGGRQLEVVFGDDEGTPEKAASLARQMIAQDKVIALIGSTPIASTHPVAQVAEEQKIPLIAIVPPASVSKDRKFVFQTPVIPEVESQTVVKYMYDTLKWKKIGLLQDGTEYGQLISSLAEKNVKDMGGESFVEKFQQTDTDFTPVLLRVKQSNPDGIYLIASAPPAPAILMKNRQQMGLQIPVVGAAALTTQKFAELVGEAGENMQVVSYLRYSNPDPEEKELADAFAAKFPDQLPNTQHGVGWDAVNLLAQALRKAGDSPAGIRDALEATQGFRTSTGVYSFSTSEHANPNASFIKVVKIQKGKFALVSALK